VVNWYNTANLSTRSEKQWLWTSANADKWTNFLGILVTIGLARLFRIVLRSLHLYSLPRRSSNECQSSGPRETGLRIFEPEETAAEAFAWHRILDALEDFSSGRIRMQSDARLQSNFVWRSCVNLLLGLSSLAFYVAILICGVVTAYIATDSIALSDHPHCGIYIPNATDYEAKSAIVQSYEWDLQEESRNWAQTCYGAERGTDGCNYFVNQEIPYTVDRNAACPFQTADLCHGNGANSIRFTTGAVSGALLGVNAPKVYEFNKTTSCSPLNMNRTYIDFYKQVGTTWSFRYYYGPSVNIGNASFQTYRHTDFGDAPMYIVDSVVWAEGPDTGWTPIPELQPEPGSSITLISVLSQAILYSQPSDDPIFPAKTKQYPGSKYWMNFHAPATILGCVDSTQWRDPERLDLGWFPLTKVPGREEPSNAHVRGAMYFLYSALSWESIYSTVSKLGPNALDAQTKISRLVSTPLLPEQWKLEAQKLFNISLARIQFKARDIARGANAGRPGFVRKECPLTPEVCSKTFMFNSNGWKNLHRGASLAVLYSCTIFIFLAIPTGEEMLLFEALPALVNSGLRSIRELLSAVSAVAITVRDMTR
jgi:hypothetical protein